MTISHEHLGRAVGIARDNAKQAKASVEACSLPVGSNLRERLPRLMWQQSLQDGLSIGLLVHRRYVGSARALLRPQFEALIRGAWMRVVATEDALSSVDDGKQELPKISLATDALDAHAVGFILLNERVAFGELRKRFVPAMHDHAHRGIRAMGKLAHENQDGAYGVGEDEPAVLLLSTAFTTMAAVALLKDAGQDHMAREVHDAGVKAAQSIIKLGLDQV